MALAKLDQSKNPKVVIITNSSLNYQDKDGNLKERMPKTAALNVISEAANVAKMDVGTLQVSFKQGEEWKNYWIDVNEKNNNVSLKPCNSADKNDIVYANAYANERCGYDYSFNEKSEAGKAFIEGLSVKAWTNEKEGRVSSYVESRVTLKNDELHKQLTEKGEGAIAILSKEKGFEVTTENELKVAKAQKAQEKQTPTKDSELSKKNDELER